MERENLGVNYQYRPVVSLFHGEGPLTTEFASKFVDESVSKWYEDIKRYGDVYQVSSPNVSVLAKNGDNVVWQVTIAGLVRDVTQNIPGTIQRLIDETVASGGRVSIDHNGDAVRRAIQSLDSSIRMPQGAPAFQPVADIIAQARTFQSAASIDAKQRASLPVVLHAPVQPGPASNSQAIGQSCQAKDQAGPVPTPGGSRHGLPSVRNY